jgi:hypothetical protein
MENVISMVAVLAAISLSRNNKSLAVIILAYYAMVFAWMVEFSGMVNQSFGGLRFTWDKVTIWYLVLVCIELLIIISICIYSAKLPKKQKVIPLFYAAMVLISLIWNAIQALSMTLHSNWFLELYTIRQEIAIPLDIAVAWLGSDNAISRKVNRAFYGTGT